MSITIGIDLGTTNSAVAWHDGVSVEIIETSSGKTLLPSVVSIDDKDRIVVGHQAQKQIRRHMRPEYVFTNIKSHIGMPFIEGEDYGLQITNVEGERWFRGPNDLDYSPVELSAEILKTLKASAERRLGKEVTQAVIAVPAYFNNIRVEKTREAGKLAGFRKVIIRTEPELAAMAYGLDKEKMSRIAVYDLGGGTFDFVLLRAGDRRLEYLAKLGDDQLGGYLYDRAIQKWLVDAYRQDEQREISKIGLLRLAPAIEDAKKELTDFDSAEIAQVGVFFDSDLGDTLDVNYTIAREKFETLVESFTRQTVEITKRALQMANKTVRDVDEVLLVGGMTRVPSVRKAVASLFGEAKLRDRENPDLVVAKGAAIAAAIEDGRSPGRTSYNHVTAQPFGLIGKHDTVHMLVPAGTPYGQKSKVSIFHLGTAEDGQTVIPIAIVQGDSRSARECTVLARYDHKVPAGPARSEKVDIEVMVDEEGQLIVAGVDCRTGQTLRILEP
ncbi:Hsp70 family protein [Henriciella pelagia]|uniref:Hsp70 family protein n=1 Tax=Henriciella pelagia TaxID=1977912 RepID=UPI00351363DA